jgi:hypothetical protein
MKIKKGMTKLFWILDLRFWINIKFGGRHEVTFCLWSIDLKNAVSELDMKQASDFRTRII